MKTTVWLGADGILLRQIAELNGTPINPNLPGGVLCCIMVSVDLTLAMPLKQLFDILIIKSTNVQGCVRVKSNREG